MTEHDLGGVLAGSLKVDDRHDPFGRDAKLGRELDVAAAIAVKQRIDPIRRGGTQSLTEAVAVGHRLDPQSGQPAGIVGTGDPEHARAANRNAAERATRRAIG